jgi:hypothetical protein
MPTFDAFTLPLQIVYPLNESDLNNCVCKRFKRTLKYFMKGFYDLKKENHELNQARLVFKDLVKPTTFLTPNRTLGKCKFCDNYMDIPFKNAIYTNENTNS